MRSSAAFWAEATEAQAISAAIRSSMESLFYRPCCCIRLEYMKWFLTIAAAVAMAVAFAALAARTSRLGERVDRLEEEQQPRLRLLALRF